MVEKIVFSLNAEKERLSILEYYFHETGNKKIPLQIYEQINKAISNISYFPYSGKLIHSNGQRVYTSYPYQIIYKFQDNEIIILNIWDSRRNPEDFNL